MRKLGLVVVVVALSAAPRSASAGPLVEGSLGLGWQVSPSVPAGFDSRQPLNIMVAPGYGFLNNLLKLELGVLASLGETTGRKFDIDLRPMVVLQPPLFPLYLRGIVAFTSVLKNNPGGSQTEFGGAVGLAFGLANIGLFIEGGALTFSEAGQAFWIVEGRAGLSLGF